MEMTPGLDAYCRRWSRDVAVIGDDRQRQGYFQQALPQLLLDRDAVAPVLDNMARGRNRPTSGGGLFEREVLLYLDPSRRFSLRLYFHPARSHTPIHDHTGWGVSGVPLGRLSVVRYDLAGPIEGDRACVEERSRQILAPGEVEITRPWNEGIHQTGTPDDALNVMISVYGRPGRRLYINTFDMDLHTVERRYPAKIAIRTFARQALALFEDH